MQPWETEEELSEERAARLLSLAVPELAGVPVRFAGAGWDNTVFRVGEDRVARFPRKATADELLAVECAVLPTLSDELPLAIPVPQHICPAVDGFPWAFAVGRWLPGEAASGLTLTREERLRHLPRLAGFLRTLHSIEPDAPPFDGLRRQLPSARRERIAPLLRRGLADAYGRGWIEPSPAYEAIVRRVDGAQIDEGSQVITHGDLDARHVVVDGGEVASIIDWGDVHVGGRGVDLALVPTYFEPDEWPRFLEAYGGCSDAEWDLALFVSLFKASLILGYALALGKRGYERTARETLRRLGAAGA